MSRKPTETRVTRIEPLARLPVFFGLKGRRVIVAGGSEAAGWKAELLAAAGARVAIVGRDQGRADAVAATPVNPGALPGVVATLVRRRLGIGPAAGA